ncbi:MAG TPA: methylated-DNA--[protein]-cysteine S-methyltransferase [Acidimicrobiales bacterium]
MHTTVIDTPTGLVEIEVDDDQLVGLNFVETSLADRDDPSGMADALRRYFDGDLDAIADLPVRFDTGTPFQQEVWRALQTIPVGETISYGELARRVGRPTGFRAVGSANGRNPVAVVVPCHRVIAADGTLGGYSGGLDNKRWLLAHEGVVLAEDQRLPGLV